jgi:hypothetical protein
MDNLPSLPLPVVGDRVEVLWGELRTAEVVKCHRTGEYNVVYETNGTVRTFVTREEQRLLPLAKKGEEREEREGRRKGEEWKRGQPCRRSQLVHRRGGA